MTTLTTQSIGAASAQILERWNSINRRLNEAARAAGVLQAQNMARAQNSAVTAQDDRQRSIQLKKRAEGSFSGNNDEREADQGSDKSEPRTPRTCSGRLNQTA